MVSIRASAVLILLVCIVPDFLPTGNALSCPKPCDESKCKLPEGCQHGLTRDICGCCFRCAMGLGEQCGGMWTQHGRCAKGLGCSKTRISQKIGVCVPANEAAEVV